MWNVQRLEHFPNYFAVYVSFSRFPHTFCLIRPLSLGKKVTFSLNLQYIQKSLAELYVFAHTGSSHALCSMYCAKYNRAKMPLPRTNHLLTIPFTLICSLKCTDNACYHALCRQYRQLGLHL